LECSPRNLPCNGMPALSVTCISGFSYAAVPREQLKRAGTRALTKRRSSLAGSHSSGLLKVSRRAS
jgi:hypothetical protein